MASDEEFLLKWHDHHQVNIDPESQTLELTHLNWRFSKADEITCDINWSFFLQSFFILVEELVQLEQLTDVTLACGDGTNHQVDNDDNRRRLWCWWKLTKPKIANEVQIFPSPAFVCTLPHALGLLSVFPEVVEREPPQGETSYHPPTWGQPKTYAAAPAIYVQVITWWWLTVISECLAICGSWFHGC